MIWNEIANKYDRLWVQKYSLGPTRQKVLAILREMEKEKACVLDIGCGTGQLLEEINQQHADYTLIGVDKSVEMLKKLEHKNINARRIHKNISSDTFDEIKPESCDIIICSHSFPYYENKQDVLKKVLHFLHKDGVAIFTQASINSKYDAFVMAIIEKTAEKAQYLSIPHFQSMVKDDFEIISQYIIREKMIMPSICGFVMRKRR